MEIQAPQNILGEILWNEAKFRRMKPDLDTARRVKILRYWAKCGDSQTRFAALYGFSVKHWNNFERGHPLSKEAAIQLVRKIPGLTLDWLHLGRSEGLPGRLRAELQEAEKELSSK